MTAGTSINAKICGLDRPESVTAAVKGGARWIGFVVFPPSPRHLAPEAITPLAALKGEAETVAVTVNADDALLSAIREAFAPDWIQLHGSESPQRVSEARAFAGKGVWKALPVAEASDLDAAAAYDGVADALLFDAKPPKGADRPGGWGHGYDYTILKKLRLSSPWLLSGGLGPTNVLDAVNAAGAQAVDVSSGIETAPGIKSTELMQNFAGALAPKAT